MAAGVKDCLILGKLISHRLGCKTLNSLKPPRWRERVVNNSNTTAAATTTLTTSHYCVTHGNIKFSSSMQDQGTFSLLTHPMQLQSTERKSTSSHFLGNRATMSTPHSHAGVILYGAAGFC